MAPRSVRETVRSPGRSLDTVTRRAMEAGLGHDFSRVRVHADAGASASAREVGAAAYAVGSHVVFDAGRYAPGTEPGRRLLAHELAHVAQQRDAPAGGELQLGSPADRAEREADAASERALGGERPTLTSGARGPLVQRNGGPIMTGGKDPAAEARKRALAVARSLETTYPGWRDALPDCPCTAAEARSSSVWTEDGFLTQLLLLPIFHSGAATAFRSTKGYPSQPGTSHGQQCTYDDYGSLITRGPGAGTPDVWSPSTDFWKHQDVDVGNWLTLDWQTYNTYWIPNEGKGCAGNEGQKAGLLDALEEIGSLAGSILEGMGGEPELGGGM